jgi:hypothetical protein
MQEAVQQDPTRWLLVAHWEPLPGVADDHLLRLR